MEIEREYLRERGSKRKGEIERGIKNKWEKIESGI